MSRNDSSSMRLVATVRLRVLDPILRAQVGGLDDINAPLEMLAARPWQPRHMLIVENLQTGLALQDLPCPDCPRSNKPSMTDCGKTTGASRCGWSRSASTGMRLGRFYLRRFIDTHSKSLCTD